jgi:hypothetical protein
MQRWEYKIAFFAQYVMDVDRQHHLNGLGADGWELVAMRVCADDMREYTFKRPVGSK